MGKIDYHNLKNGKNLYKHGLNGTRIYNIWEKMKQRTQNTNHMYYKNYGGRGVAVCEEWDDFIPFYDWAMGNGYNDSLCIDRINNDGDYTPENCRWVTFTQNIRNRSNTVFAEKDGKTLPLAEWAEVLGIEYQRLYHMVRRKGMSLEEVVR